ncbi:MAG: hypothetical protein GWO16_15735, partial [Gammaproteobacteria bacterium]|nr:hypothetical protein [Gammaproteobacteria bacterium]
MAKSKRKRILVGKLERQGGKDRITHEEIAQAIRRFKDDGGLIKKLPPQRDEYRNMVGNHLQAAY